MMYRNITTSIRTFLVNKSVVMQFDQKKKKEKKKI